MENLDVILLTTVLATLFVVFFVFTYKEFSRMGKEGFVEDPNAKKYGRDALFVLAQRLFDDEIRKPKGKKQKKQKRELYQSMYRNMTDMESDGVRFSDEDVKRLGEIRKEMTCEYSGLPSMKSYEK